MVDKLVYAASGIGGLNVIDASSPSSPVVLGNLANDELTAGALDISGSMAYIADSFNGLWLVDVAISQTPALVNSYPAEYGFRDVEVENGVAYAVNWEGVSIIDVSDPENLTLIASVAIDGYPEAVTATGDLLYVANRSHGVLVIDVADPAAPQVLGSFDTPGSTVEISVRGDLIYTAEQEGGLQILSGGVYQPVLTSNFPDGKPGSFFTLQGTGFPANRAATITGNGVVIGTVQTDVNGSFSLILDTSQADPGGYLITASVNPSASMRLTLAEDAPIREKEGEGPVLAVPQGIGRMAEVFVPVVLKQSIMD